MPAWTSPAIYRDLALEWAPAVAHFDVALVGKNLSVGVIGGSISCGVDLIHPARDAYPALLARSPRLSVRNYAIRATGVSLPSFCLDTMIAPAEMPDILLIEYAANDGHMGHIHGVRSIGGGDLASHALDPLASMERLLRRLPRRTIPILLYMCGPNLIRLFGRRNNKTAAKCSTPSAAVRCPGSCESLYTPLARRYGVRELSLIDDANATRINWNRDIHPDAAGHQVMAISVMRAIADMVTAGAVGGQYGSRLRPHQPIFMDQTWEQANVTWRCLTCDWGGCQALRPKVRETVGFTVQGNSEGLTPHQDGHVRKFGYASRRVGDSIAFELGHTGSAHVAVALLCSHFPTVGAAMLELWSAAAAHSYGEPLLRLRSKVVDLCWDSPSTQQCVIDLGIAQLPSNATALVRVRVQETTSVKSKCNRNSSSPPVTHEHPGWNPPDPQVKVFGLYSQPLR